MKSLLKILAFTALLLISKFTKEDEPLMVPADNQQAVVDSIAYGVQTPVLVSNTAADLPDRPVSTGGQVQTLVVTPATIK